jgi:dihydrofolate reductase
VEGGAAIIRQYLQARSIIQLHIPIVPVILGTGEVLFSDIDLLKPSYVVTEHVPTARATHIVLTKQK